MGTSTAAVQEQDARREERHQLNLKGSARVALQIDIVDVSASGVKARLSLPLPIGTLIKLGLNGSTRHARVVWREGEITGCEFLAPLEIDELAALVGGVDRLAHND